VCREEDLPAGASLIVEVGGRSIGIFNSAGDLYAVRNACPHQGAELCLGAVSGTMLPSTPQVFLYGDDGLILRCPWHGWEFDLRSGRSLFDPERWYVRTYPVSRREGWIMLDA